MAAPRSSHRSRSSRYWLVARYETLRILIDFSGFARCPLAQDFLRKADVGLAFIFDDGSKIFNFESNLTFVIKASTWRIVEFTQQQTNACWMIQFNKFPHRINGIQYRYFLDATYNMFPS